MSFRNPKSGRNYDTEIADLYERLAELNAVVEALSAENRIDRDIPDKMHLISGQYRKMLHQLHKLEANIQPVSVLIRNLRNFIHPD